MSQSQKLGMMGSRRDVEVAEALLQVVEQFNRIGAQARKEAAAEAQREFLLMIAPLVATEIQRITSEGQDVNAEEEHVAELVAPGWRLLVTAGDEVVVRSPEGGPGGMTIPPDGAPLSARLLRDLVKTIVGSDKSREEFCGTMGATGLKPMRSDLVTALRA